jgi:hypothetical protein
LRIRNSLLGGHSNVHIAERKFLLGRRVTVLFLVCRAFELKASTYFLNVYGYSSIILRSYRGLKAMVHCGFGVFVEILILLNMTSILVHTPNTDAVLRQFSIRFEILLI